MLYQIPIVEACPDPTQCSFSPCNVERIIENLNFTLWCRWEYAWDKCCTSKWRGCPFVAHKREIGFGRDARDQYKALVKEEYDRRALIPLFDARLRLVLALNDKIGIELVIMIVKLVCRGTILQGCYLFNRWD